MNNLAAHVNGGAKGFKSDSYDINRTNHAGAKATRLEQQHPLLAGGSLGTAEFGGGIEGSCGHSASIPTGGYIRQEIGDWDRRTEAPILPDQSQGRASNGHVFCCHGWTVEG